MSKVYDTIQETIAKLLANEGEFNPHPKQVKLSGDSISDDDVNNLIAFLEGDRQQLYLIHFEGDEHQALNEKLAFIARRKIIKQNAERMLSEDNPVPVNPLKLAIEQGNLSVKPRIQVQLTHQQNKPFPKSGSSFSSLSENESTHENTPVKGEKKTLQPIANLKLEKLRTQLEALNVLEIDKESLTIIGKNEAIFCDGIVANNLPAGFSIETDGERQYLTFSKHPQTLPNALAPALNQAKLGAMPTKENFNEWCSLNADALFVDDVQQTDLFNLLSEDAKKAVNALSHPSEHLSLLSQCYIAGGSAHTELVAKRLKQLENKEISLDFIKSASTKNQLVFDVTTLNNLQKLAKLTKEQRQWWNQLVSLHLTTGSDFDFNAAFAGFNEVFISFINDYHLSLPHPCPIDKTDAPFLVTLNRIKDVIQHSPSPQDQIDHLAGLNWGPLGAHYAKMHAKPKFSIATEVMALNEAQDSIAAEPNETWRFISQNWNKQLSVSDVEKALEAISEFEEKETLAQIYAATFAAKEKPNYDEHKEHLRLFFETINKTQPKEVRTSILAILKNANTFKPVPSLNQVKVLIGQLAELNQIDEENFNKNLSSYMAVAKAEGFDVYERIKARVQKTGLSSEHYLKGIEANLQFSLWLAENRERLVDLFAPNDYENAIKLFTSLNDLPSDALIDAIQNYKEKQGLDNFHLAMAHLGAINIDKSKGLPESATLVELFNELSTQKLNAVQTENLIQTKLVNSEFGTGEISNPGKLIVNGIAKAAKNRGAILDLLMVMNPCKLVRLKKGQTDIPELTQKMKWDKFKKQYPEFSKLLAPIEQQLVDLEPRRQALRKLEEEKEKLLEKIKDLSKANEKELNKLNELEIKIKKAMESVKELDNTRTFILFEDKLYHICPITTLSDTKPFIASIEPIKVENTAEYQSILESVPQDSQLHDIKPEHLKPLTKLSLLCDPKITINEFLNHEKVSDGVRETLQATLYPFVDNIYQLLLLIESENPDFEALIDKIDRFEKSKNALVDKDNPYKLNFGLVITGTNLLSLLFKGQPNFINGKKEEIQGLLSGFLESSLMSFYKVNMEKIDKFFNDPSSKSIIDDLTAEKVKRWLATFNDTLSLLFIFKEELIENVLVPEVKKILSQLDTQDSEFESAVLAKVEDFPDTPSESQSAVELLREYKEKVEGICEYLSLLIEMKKGNELSFKACYDCFKDPVFSKANDRYKKQLLSSLVRYVPETTLEYLKRTISILKVSPNVSNEGLERAVSSLDTLFTMDNIDEDKRLGMFELVFRHNLNNPTPFPLDELVGLENIEGADKGKLQLLAKKLVDTIQNNPSLSAKAMIDLIQSSKTFVSQYPEWIEMGVNLLQKMPKENIEAQVTHYASILKHLSQATPEKSALLLPIFSGIAKEEKNLKLAAVDDLSGYLNKGDALEAVHALFAYPPYPAVATLNELLSKPDNSAFKAFCTQFDGQPFAKLGEKGEIVKRQIETHFSTGQIKQALANVEDLIQKSGLSHANQLLLARELTYIQAIGYPMFGEGKGLVALPRTELQAKGSELLMHLRENAFENAEQKRKAELNFLAYSREIFFRSTGLFPNTTQMLTLLLSLHVPSNLLMQISTGEGKSLITPMLGLLQWAQGGTVDICTSDSNLLATGYEEYYKNFFDFFKDEHGDKLVKSGVIKADSQPEAYHLNGINCSTIQDIALFRLAAKEENKTALVESSAPMHLLLDECDDTLLDQKTLFKLVGQANQKNDSDWIFECAYEFIRSETFKDKKKDEDEDADIFNGKLKAAAKGDITKLKQIKVSPSQLKQWINASLMASQLEEEKHFIRRKNEQTGEGVCIPLEHSYPKAGSIFSDGIQQALHARMNVEYKAENYHYPIQANPPVIASTSAKDLINRHLASKGRLIGVSGTPGDDLELGILSAQIKTEAWRVPTHQPEKRDWHPAQFAHTADEKKQKVLALIKSLLQPALPMEMSEKAPKPLESFDEIEKFRAEYNKKLEEWKLKQTQPILLVTEDFKEAREMHEALKHYEDLNYTIQLVTGRESEAELDAIKDKAKEPKTITIGTAMLGRGTDIKVGSHPRGLAVIQTYPDSTRMTRQIAGRAARNGKPGEYHGIYQIEKPNGFFSRLLYNIIGFFFPSYRRKIDEKAMMDVHKRIQEEANLDRIYTQSISHYQQVLFEQIHAWEKLLLETLACSHEELHDFRELMFNEFAKLSQKQADVTDLKESLNTFKADLCAQWKVQLNSLWLSKAKAVLENMSKAQKMQFDYLKGFDLKERLQTQSYLQTQTEAFKQESAPRGEQNIDLMLLDQAGVVKHYDGSNVALNLSRNRHLIPHLVGQLCNAYSPAISALKLKDAVEKGFFTRVKEWFSSWFSSYQSNETLALVKRYTEATANASDADITEMLENIKKVIIDYNLHFQTLPLSEKFKYHGTLELFFEICQQANFSLNDDLTAIKCTVEAGVTKHLADYLVEQFAWANAKKTDDKDRLAAFELYSLAKALQAAPADSNMAKALYAALHKQHLALNDCWFVDSTRKVIATAINSIEVLSNTPECWEKNFRDEAHDQALANHQMELVNRFIDKNQPDFKDAAQREQWANFRDRLNKIAKSSETPSYLLTEVLAAVKRAIKDEALKSQRSALKDLCDFVEKKRMKLHDKKAFKINSHTRFFQQKSKQMSQNLGVDIQIQSSQDGVNTGIDLFVDSSKKQNMPTWFNDMVGYKSTALDSLLVKRAELLQNLALFSDERLYTLENADGVKQLLGTDKLDDTLEGLAYNYEMAQAEWAGTPLILDCPTDIQPSLDGLTVVKRRGELHQADLQLVTGEAGDKLKAFFNTIKELKLQRDSAINALPKELQKLRDKLVSEKQKPANEMDRKKIEKLEKLILPIDTLENEIKELETKLEAYKKQLAGNLETEVKQRLKAHVTEAVKAHLAPVKAELDEMLSTLNAQIESEQKSAHVRKVSFFTGGELLEFEAKVCGEKGSVHETVSKLTK